MCSTRYGIKAAIRAERRRLLHPASDGAATVVDALSQEGLSEEPVQQEIVAAEGAADCGGDGVLRKNKLARQRRSRRRKPRRQRGGQDNDEEDDEEEEDDEDEDENRRQREHPFIVTEPGEVARGKKNGLDYLFHLYDQCREFLIQVQNIARERGEKCPTKVRRTLIVTPLYAVSLEKHWHFLDLVCCQCHAAVGSLLACR